MRQTSGDLAAALTSYQASLDAGIVAPARGADGVDHIGGQPEPDMQFRGVANGRTPA